jgi:ubiquinone/menaquinone biosynthesis C-methylase UbiE
MREDFLADSEYTHYFPHLNGIRTQIAAGMPVIPGMFILDVATGYGYFALELVYRYPDVTIVGIDLCENDVTSAGKHVANAGLENSITFELMDAAHMSFKNCSFDAVVNFLGFEDIHMTRGRTGIQQTCSECSRVLRPGGLFCISVMPPEEMTTKVQETEVALFSYLCGATWLSRKEYEEILLENGFIIMGAKKYHTGKKLMPEQAITEIQYACDNIPRLYNKKTRTFEEVWRKFGKDIENHGMGHYSAVLLIIARKP